MKSIFNQDTITPEMITVQEGNWRKAGVGQPDVTMSYAEYRELSHKAAKCDRLVAAFEKEGKTA